MAATTLPRRRVSAASRRNTLTGLAFCLPWIIGLLAFRAYPIAAAFWYSLTDYQGMNPPEFIGFANYASLTRDSELGNAASNTIQYTVMAIPCAILFALSIALILNSKIRGLPFYRTLFFLPILVPDAAVVTDQSRKIVMTVRDDGTVEPKVVRTGPTYDNLRIIRSGLAAMDRVVIDGLVRARPGAKVTPQPGKIDLEAQAN